MLLAVKHFMEHAPYKSERPSAENLSEFLSKLVQLDDSSREWIFTNMAHLLVGFANYMNGTQTMAKVYLLQTV